jgi:hypothetical protein
MSTYAYWPGRTYICCFQNLIGLKDCRSFGDGDKRKVVKFGRIVLFTADMEMFWAQMLYDLLKNAQGCCIWPQAIDVLGDFVVVVVVCEGGS